MSTDPKPFGFRVRRAPDWWYGFDEVQPDDAWSVSLPHQCDAWDIVGDDFRESPHAACVAEFERFIAEAQAALEALRERREIRP